jgi:hypothetical protein
MPPGAAEGQRAEASPVRFVILEFTFERSAKGMSGIVRSGWNLAHPLIAARAFPSAFFGLV